MGTFGENLRREREMRGVSLEEISDATKISVRTLQALESSQFEKLPGGIFTRSFIRTYAKYLGLDEEAVMAEFQLVAPASAQQADLSRMNQQRPPRPDEHSRAGVIGLLVALAVLLAGGFTYYHYARRAPKLQTVQAQAAPQIQPSNAPSVSTAQPSSTPTPPAGAATSTAVAPVAGGNEPEGVAAETSKGSSPTPAATPAAALTLQVAATERCWVAVESDGKPAGQRVMEPNEIQTFQASKSFDLMTGNAEGIILTLNGKTLDPLGRRGEIKKVHLTLEDAQNATH